MIKRKSAKEILAESFREIAEKKPVDKITIREITDNCGYSPATFYRQFKDKYDLIAWIQTRMVAAIMDRFAAEGYSWKQALLDGLHVYSENRDYLTNLFLNTSGMDSFLAYLSDINFQTIRQHILSKSEKKKLTQTTEIYIRFYSIGVAALTGEWILGRFTIVPEKLADVLLQSMPEPLRPYFI